MKICIHRGTKEIGGTCVEIESQGKRLVLDVGLPLDAPADDTFPLHPIRGFDAPDPSLLGVVISHPHQDHYGLAHRLPDETNFSDRRSCPSDPGCRCFVLTGWRQVEGLDPACRSHSDPLGSVHDHAVPGRSLGLR